MGSRAFLVFLLAVAAEAAFADDIQSGLWEISLETRVPGSPEYAPPAVTLRQCLTAEDAKDPSRVLGGAANPGAGDCVYTEQRYEGDRFHFAMECSGALGIQTRGDVRYSATSMEGSLVSSAGVQGQRIEFDNRLSARRVGGC